MRVTRIGVDNLRYGGNGGSGQGFHYCHLSPELSLLLRWGDSTVSPGHSVLLSRVSARCQHRRMMVFPQVKAHVRAESFAWRENAPKTARMSPNDGCQGQSSSERKMEVAP